MKALMRLRVALMFLLKVRAKTNTDLFAALLVLSLLYSENKLLLQKLSFVTFKFLILKTVYLSNQMSNIRCLSFRTKILQRKKEVADEGVFRAKKQSLLKKKIKIAELY